jgi:hypothetical protein
MPHKGGLGDAPIDSKHYRMMNTLASVLDETFNEDLKKKHTGFILMVFPFDNHEGRCNYISNAQRADVVELLKEQIKRFEAQDNNPEK